MTVTCDTPGVASNRRRTITSAVVRMSSGVGAGPPEAAAGASAGSRATNMISPMIDERGARIGGSTSSGSPAATVPSFSVTVWRAR